LDISIIVALTGATGFVGSHVLTGLREHGHQVTAVVRDDADGETVAARGATPTTVDLYDRAALVSVLRNADAAIHTASPGDETSAHLDAAVADGRYVVDNGLHPTVAGLTEAAAVAVGGPGAVAGSDDEGGARLGDDFAEVLLGDQAPPPRRFAPSSAGLRPVQGSPTSSGTGVVPVPQRAADRWPRCKRWPDRGSLGRSAP
jgi:NAD dependent epimerase/dehydratase family